MGYTKKAELQPYQNKSLKNIPREKWKFIPDFNDSYMVSSLGRIKSLSRPIYFSNGAQRIQNERILSPGHVHSHNYYIGDTMTVLNITLWFEGKKKTFSIRRLVYNCFVEPIDLFDYNIHILCKDNNGLNLDYKNLVKATSGQQQKRIFKDQRSISCFSYLDMKAIAQSHSIKRGKQVTQYTLKGKKVAVFSSIQQAEDTTGVTKTSISRTVRGKCLKAGNFIWRYGNGHRKINLKDYWEKGRLIAAQKHQIKVIQYDKQDKFIAEYESITAASKATGIQISAISKCINGILRSTKGYVWKTAN